MVLFSFLCSIIFVILYGHTNADCPAGWQINLNGQKCLKVFTNSLNWLSSEQYCNNFGGNLASVSNAFDNAFIFGLAENISGMPEWWLGGNTVLLPKTWSWSDGTNFTYQNFDQGQSCGNGDCCLEQHSGDTTWWIKSCLTAMPFVCEIPSTQSTGSAQPITSTIYSSSNTSTTSRRPSTTSQNGFDPCQGLIVLCIDTSNVLSNEDFSVRFIA